MDGLRKRYQQVQTILHKISHPINVYGTQFPLIFALCCSGLVPYKVVKQKLKNSKFCYLVAGINLTLFAYSFVQTVVKNTSFIQSFFKSDTSKFGNTLYSFVSFVSMIIIYSSCFVHRKQMKNIFDHLFIIDLKLKKISFEISHRQGFRYNVFALIILWVVYYSFTIACISLVLVSNKTVFLHSWTSYFLPNFMLCLVVFMFVCVLKQIQNRYNGCNQVK